MSSKTILEVERTAMSASPSLVLPVSFTILSGLAILIVLVTLPVFPDCLNFFPSISNSPTALPADPGSSS